MNHVLRRVIACAVLVLPWAGVVRGEEKVNFSRDVRPILSENCFACHGFDDAARKGKLRLDTQEGATKARDGRAAVAPGDVAKSEMIRRILTDDADDRMPPADGGKRLTAAQVDVLKRWVAQGADYTGHWAFGPVKAQALPAVKDTSWGRNEIDRFVLAKLEAAGLRPSAEAPKAALIRRVTFDLTGLPPTPAEVEGFAKDASPDAYEKVVDRLLASPHYGERMALDWMDAARFADTNGYHLDNGRDMTAWREWVIDAFNANVPFDRFTVEQLAGDLLPEPTVAQRVATGFHRNHMINFEGGAVPEEYHAAYLVDRVNTTATVWMGLTVACAQCHDHKYDPIRQAEYYRMYAFFNNVPEKGLDGNKGNAAPMIRVPAASERRRLEELASQIAEAEKALDAPDAEADAEQEKWERAGGTARGAAWAVVEVAEYRSAGNASLARLEDKSIRASGANPAKETYTLRVDGVPAGTTAVRLETLADDALPMRGPGRSKNGNLVLTELKVLGGGGGKPLKLAKASADFAQADFPASNAIDGKAATGWGIDPAAGKSHHLVVELAEPLKAEGSLTVVAEFQSQFANHQAGRVRVSVTDSSAPHGGAGLPEAVAKALATPAEKRSAAQRAEVRRHFRGAVSAKLKSTAGRVAELRREQKAIEEAGRTAMVMQEMEKPRDTFVMVRGQYDKRGERVTADVPAMLPPLAKDQPRSRLGLARWLVSAEHPLTARVAVNRYWQAYFGNGIVKSSDDFGSQGDWPSHPELLDWLAGRFVSSGWDVKGMQRLIVTSAAYRQASKVTPELVAKDPENRLLARGPRLRLAAEFIRDQALAVSGLLNREVGGASVSPYQPAGLWEELMSREDGKNWTAQTYTQSTGRDLYRRTMYTFWKRTSPPPSLSTFDAPDREVCTVRRARTNTPLQALVLMNDPTYVEAARKLAERVLTEGGATVEERVGFVFRLITAREPEGAEVGVLRRAYERHVAHYRASPELAEKLLKVGESPADGKLDRAEVAAWAMVSSVVLNLDEAVTKN